MPFDIAIVGAGISGLASAINLRRDNHSVTVYEGSLALSEAGAGLQLSPNCVRLLDQLGLKEKLQDSSVEPKSMTFRKYSTGDVIKVNPLNPQLAQIFGSGYYLIHRAAFQQVLYEAAIESGARVHFNSPVASVDENSPVLTMKNGERIQADLIIGADGIRSLIRHMLHPDSPQALPSSSSYCAYRALVSRASMAASELTAPLMLNMCQTIWLGPSRHLVGYPVSNGDFFNLVAVCPGQTTLGKWTEHSDPNDLRNAFNTFEPAVQMLLSHVDKTSKWLLADMPPLDQWASISGKVTLIGDAAHAMLPFLAQGAAQAIEDAAVLAACLQRASSVSDIPRTMIAYEQIRKPRVEKVVAATRENGEIFHLVDETEQNLRNEAMMTGSLYIKGVEGDEPETGERRTLQKELSSGQLHAWIFKFDAIADACSQLDGMKLLRPSTPQPETKALDSD